MQLFLDCDGTLIDKDENIRPFVKELFEIAHAKGFSIFIWSAGGVTYAEQIISRVYKKLGITTPAQIVQKDSKLIRNRTEDIVCIDDQLEVVENFIRQGWRGFKVPYYESTIHKEDHELKDIAEKL